VFKAGAMKKILTDFSLLFLVMNLVGCATIDSAALQKTRQANIDHYTLEINDWRGQFLQEDYLNKLKMLESYIKKQTNAESHVLKAICKTCDYYIRSGKSFSQDINLGLEAANSEGWLDIYQLYFDAIQRSVGDIAEPPANYSQARDSLLECFSIYSQLHSLVRFPQGSCASFNKTIQDLFLLANKNLDKLAGLLQ
jgi:hypothetical protein